jgi:hypothetical protein
MVLQHTTLVDRAQGEEQKLRLEVYGMTRTPEGLEAEVGVACPAKGRRVLLDECADCVLSFGFVTEPDSGATYLRCGAVSAKP